MFRTVPLSIISSFSQYTQQWYTSYRLRAGSGRSILILLASCQRNCMAYTIAVCTVKTPDDGQRNCPKYVEFYSKNKFEKLVHLVGFIIRIKVILKQDGGCQVTIKLDSHKGQLQAFCHRLGRNRMVHISYKYFKKTSRQSGDSHFVSR